MGVIFIQRGTDVVDITPGGAEVKVYLNMIWGHDVRALADPLH